MNLRSLTYLLGLGLVLGLVAGCSESPEAKAAKEARQQAQKAAAIVEDYKLNEGYDYSAAKQEVDKALAMANRAGGQADSVYFASADLTSTYASKLQGVVSDSEEEVAEKLQKCIQIARRLSDCQAQLSSIEMLMDSGEQEAKSLKTLLYSEKEGIEAKLAENKEKLEGLLAQLNSYKKVAETAKASADSIQLKADKMLRQAELLEGEARIELERDAYSLLKGKDSNNSVFYYQKALQDNLDKAESVQVLINTVKPLIPKLQSDIEYVAKRISELDKQDQTYDFTGQLASLKSQYDEIMSALEAKIADFNEAFSNYSNDVASQIELYAEAQANYAKVKSEGLRQNAQLRMADCDKAIAGISASTYEFVKRVSTSSEIMTQLKLDQAGDKVKAVSEELSSLASDYAAKTQQAFESAFQKYEDVIDRYSSGEFADVAVRNYMTAIYQRLNFTAIEDDLDATKQKLLDKVEQIKEISIQADSSFGNSKVAGLFSKYGIEFKTAEQRLQEEYLDLKVKFSAVQNSGSQQRQDQMRSLLKDFNSLEKPEDEQFYNDLVKYIYELLREDWVAIYEMLPENAELDVFSQYLAQDTAPEESYDTEAESDSNDPNS
ncbi:MAG: hypothetical protein ACIAQZ_06395 [Sedimentisphaeraceae bacterium JB056]